MPAPIPDKIYYKIGEVAEIVGVEAYVLRYWESEFTVIKPVRAGSKQRLYRRQDLDNLIEIKRLLYDEKFTIAGAKKRMTAKAKAAAVKPEDSTALLQELKTTLIEIKEILE